MSLWSCTTCSKTFTRKGDLTRHELLHTGIRPHVCETCGKGFAQFSGLKTHRNVHSKAKPYICGIGTCTKAFGDPSSRTRHRKETHRREGAYKCIVTDCETRIKRRSAFAAHLRKHGFDTKSLDLDAIALQSGGRGTPPPAHSASPDVENNHHHTVESRSTSPSVRSHTSETNSLPNSGDATHFANNNGWSGDDPLGCQRASWSPENGALLVGSRFSSLDQTMKVGPSLSPNFPHDAYPHPTGNIESQLFFDDIFSIAADYPLFMASPLHLPVLEPFMEAGSDGYQSSSSSPMSTYSALYPSHSREGMVSPSLANNATSVQHSAIPPASDDFQLMYR